MKLPVGKDMSSRNLKFEYSLNTRSHSNKLHVLLDPLDMPQPVLFNGNGRAVHQSVFHKNF